MRKGWLQKLPKTLSRRELVQALERAGGVCVSGGSHQEKWHFQMKDGVRTVPLSIYDEYHISFYQRLFVHELGITKNQLKRLLNGEAVSIPGAVIHSRLGQAPPASD